jgi:hypothetical protein
VLQEYPQDTVNQTVITKDTDNFPSRLSGRHIISKCPDQKGPTSKLARRRCIVCSKNEKWKDTRYEYKECNVSICVDRCFERYHTQENY